MSRNQNFAANRHGTEEGKLQDTTKDKSKMIIWMGQDPAHRFEEASSLLNDAHWARSRILEIDGNRVGYAHAHAHARKEHRA